MNLLKIFSLLVFLFPGFVLAGEWQIDKTKNKLVKFISDAPIEDFEGVTDNIDGFMFWEGENLTAQSEMYLEVDLNSVDTGIGLRNRHMREKYLHTDKYPFTYYKGKIKIAEKTSVNEYKVETEGTIFIHGVEKHLSVEGTMTQIKDDEYRIQAQFVVALTDFNIEVPKLMFFKIDENMNLVLDFYIKIVREQN
jgi:polyisoprenoid-binding protein YceI